MLYSTSKNAPHTIVYSYANGQDVQAMNDLERPISQDFLGVITFRLLVISIVAQGVYSYIEYANGLV